MSPYEILTTLVSLLAIVVSAVSLVRTRRISEKQLEFQKIAADLSAKQMQILEREEAARINVRLEPFGRSHRFVISNDGKAVAKKIYFSLDGRSNDNPLDPEEYKDKIPIPSLHPGNSVTLLAMLDQESDGKYGVLIRWTNPDGKEVSDEIFTSV